MKKLQLEEVCEGTTCQICGVETKIWFFSSSGKKIGFCEKCEGIFRQMVLDGNKKVEN